MTDCPARLESCPHDTDGEGRGGPSPWAAPVRCLIVWHRVKYHRHLWGLGAGGQVCLSVTVACLSSSSSSSSLRAARGRLP